MPSDLFIILGVVLIGFLLSLIFIRKWLKDSSLSTAPSRELIEWLKTTNQRLDDQNRSFISTLQQSTKTLNERLDNAARFIADVKQNIGEMSEIGRSIKEFEELLRSPKLRGNLGEQVLKELLTQMLPKSSFHLQYAFKSGAKVDAAIKTTQGIIPIDSKFPLENFRKMYHSKNEEAKTLATREFTRDVRNHIESISKKYVLTEEGTIDYALMYLPSEAVYYEVVNNPDLFDYANKNRVLPVSPVTFYAYLRAILMSFEGQKIELKAKQILTLLRSVQKDYGGLEESLTLLSKHLTNAYNQMSQVNKNVTRLGQKISSSNLLT
ncbi:hypothetical protein A3D05_05275 [Candidatus Gottesmanbacteria bacterium RIFCSPHIGHO2_02_FULL_40_24]|uniref:DNA recombination protein RmuC n=1 Tax=Candidatus Gottesmanbacteria bacterium RIFCSPHIGHO2_01_FULL_40_15 TaxID=1798376 RepID=A0A1F5Z6S6_9BACT|nr:MAG: hypothetical protein A2777_01910 [Candidatus Gottesmanbacteria bacterium RIFCSPHIGHO2_01_FULL_40_15]OGG16443.1 MAG: hypothetical protein A3D05_05275 [Candidatus Gottesmanbacteria bacterium RIFCSPHIGHO2_02_FULL_40_24]OGG22724.1 MAG: hypothetical protein A3B48_02905 [Candidatus Gottesmanbacteria bacterium RIFCSPLOWO2_01_FULL_40_10]OGG25557.1 MAG: hypothetical protein A3E42_04425 [Candidatus Gottesmanbacteria bacterium RIFCSPHIGHO2_12_FULL_40_13]OGG32564.1 MAG: hypothetical protein A3I80_0